MIAIIINKGVFYLMKPAQQSLALAIKQFAQKYLDNFQQNNQSLPKIEHDSDWPSPCEVGAIDKEGFIAWQPCEIREPLDFDNVEHALGFKLHPDVATYFTQIYSEALLGYCSEGRFELLFAWSKEDYQRLQQNIIGHVLMKQKLKQQPTIFFAVTDEDDINLVINNDNGEVWAEPVGCEPNKFLAPSLTQFIESISLQEVVANH